MRLILSVTALLVAGPALAQSIETLKALPPGAANDSITRISCPSCPALQPKKTSYDVPALATGKQVMELRTVSGKQKIYRTEAWLGGSPVVYVSTPTPEMIAALTVKPIKGHDPIGDGIDQSAKTAAVSAPTPGLAPVVAPLQLKAPVTANMQAPDVAPATLDTSGFTLRQP